MEKLKEIKTVTTLGILLALGVVLKNVASIDIGPYIRIGFSDIPTIIAGTLFGPALGGIFGALQDIVNYFTSQQNGGFFPGFTLSSALLGTVFGLFLYNKEITWIRVAASELIRNLFINLVLHTLWLYIMRGQEAIAMLPVRALKNFIMLPINIIISYFLLVWILRAYKYVGREVR